MAKKLKVYQTSVGFFDLAVAAPSMKAALEAWGANRNLFHEGVAKQSDDPDIIAATIAKPGVVLRRPVGSHARFQEHSELPTHLAADGPDKNPPTSSASTKRQRRQPDNPRAERKAALAFEYERKRRERERANQEAAQQKKRERRERTIAKAQAALDAAQQKHEKQAAEMRAARDALENKSKAEDARWEKERARLELALRQARDGN